ncbi:MAG: hypothetical protein WD844_15490 [Thermoleophilaceae bacterium]
MRALAAGAATAIVLALTACGGDDEPDSRVTRDATRIGETVEQLERALAARDFRRICRRLFTEALRERLGGGECPGKLRRSVRDVRSPSITVEAISLQGSRRARARVVTRAERQAPARDVIVFVREGGGFRVDGLGAMPES